MKPQFDQNVSGALLRWYDEHARDLPWRRTSDPYAIMVSEFMLQQTQVKTVIPYYRSFLERFPSFAHLANAPLERVLEAWKGLGYYRRARNLHAAAKAIVDRFGGEAPASWDEMRGLPGIGDYTAAAVLSIAYGKPYPVVDGNVIRVGARLLAADEPADSSRLRREIASGLAAIIPHDRPGDFNQAMMELGATLCSVQRPACERCPVTRYCRARAEGREVELPVPARRSKVKEERFHVLVLRMGGATLLVKRPEEGLLAGLWEFPRAALGDEGAKTPERIFPVLASLGVIEESPAPDLGSEAKLRGDLIGGVRIERLGTVDHRFSHLIWRLDVLRVEVSASHRMDAAERPEGTGRWTPDSMVDTMALPKVMQNVWELVKAHESERDVRRRA